MGSTSKEAEATSGDGEPVDTPEPVIEEVKNEKGKGKKPKRKKGTNFVRRTVLEVTRAVSISPWRGDVTFNAASPGATPSAQKKGSNPVPYAVEMHATRYQYGIAFTPERLRDPSRAVNAIEALCSLGTVAGNHGRFLFDFSPDAVVIRITDDPAPRLLYCFETPDDGRTVAAPRLAERVTNRDIQAEELIVAGVELVGSDRNRVSGVHYAAGVAAARDEAMRRINERLGLGG
jgi:CRISPR-associated protein Cst2